MFKRVLVLGSNGQVGSELLRSLTSIDRIVEGWNRQHCDFSNTDAVLRKVSAFQPDLIVNAAAYTAVDKAEDESFLAYTVNAVTPTKLARFAADTGAMFVHYSTDYVYDGEKSSPYVESDIPAPRSVYGCSKAAGDLGVMSAGCDFVILRTSWIHGKNGANFVRTMLRLLQERDDVRVVGDQFGAPTSARLIADVTALIVARRSDFHSRPISDNSGVSPSDTHDRDFPSGLYHLAPSGRCSWYEYAKFIAKLAEDADIPLKTSVDAVIKIKSEDFRVAAERPANSCLNTDKLRKAFEIDLPFWGTDVADTFSFIIRPNYDIT